MWICCSGVPSGQSRATWFGASWTPLRGAPSPIPMRQSPSASTVPALTPAQKSLSAARSAASNTTTCHLRSISCLPCSALLRRQHVHLADVRWSDQELRGVRHECLGNLARQMGLPTGVVGEAVEDAEL